MLLAVAYALARPAGEVGAAPQKLFPTELPSLQWTTFAAAGFSQPAAGILFKTGQAPCCGVALGGIGTGCIRLDADGTFGYGNLFQNYPRQPKLCQPFLGLSVGGRTWVLASSKIIRGGVMEESIEPAAGCWDPKLTPPTRLPALTSVESAREIHYWGHYPVADLEYETDAPVSVGLRAWAPFLPGNAEASNIPGAVFEVYLRNLSSSAQKGTIAFSFPGPTAAEAGTENFPRKSVTERGFKGMLVSGTAVNYAIGMVGKAPARFGRDLNADPSVWSRIDQGLPEADAKAPGTSVAADFSLAQREVRTVRFLLAWHVPHWGKGNYTRWYAGRYTDAAQVAVELAQRHAEFLQRILAWQQAIYTDNGLPVWLRDCLVNNLYLIAETSEWAQSKPPLEWAGAQGLFGMVESTRIMQQLECIPCSWYGNIPIVYFFPELGWSTLKGYKQGQRADGAAPFVFGPPPAEMDPPGAWDNQISLNGVCYVDLVDRLWLRTGNDALLREFYDSVKKSTTLTATMGEPPESVISMPPGGGTEWWEGWPWTGMTAHAGGMHLSNLAIAARMVDKMGDQVFAQQCRKWLAQGQKAMEEKMWVGDHYLLMWNLNSGKKVDKIMANQLDGDWANLFHGLPGVFRPDRAKIALDTVKRTCLVDVGSVSFAAREGEPELTTYGIFPPEIMILGMTFIYHGARDTGLEIVLRAMDNLIRRQRIGWDLPNMIRADTGARTFGTDYYQNLMLWSLPAALDGQDLAAPLRPGGLVDRVLKAAQQR
ncbi:MAG: hypothetical protein HY717_16485 [Planctomycetes bacterium]|nr:hypothetical protein [Planctomycetota bacterium]